MGKQKSQRREDKRRRHAASRGSGEAFRPGRDADTGHGPASDRGASARAADDIDRLFAAAAAALRAGDDDRFEQVIALLDQALTGAGGQGLVDRRAAVALADALRAAWHHGWQPADVVRLANRRLDRTFCDLVADVIAADVAGYRAEAVHPHWHDQITRLELAVWWTDAEPHLAQWRRRWSVSRTDSLRVAASLVWFFAQLPVLPVLCPPPGDTRVRVASWSAPKSAASPVLERIRALLTKAESTTFPEEAEALSAKAQELMATHSIDRLALAASRGEDRRPIGRRIGVDDPYAAAKSLLLDRVATANRCRAVWTADLGFATVFGAEGDVDSVDVLFTSLLTQATAALRIADRIRRTNRAGRTRSFRQSFHVGYAIRIGARLADVTNAAEVAATASHGDDLLPVLAGHAADVDEAVDSAFPGLTQRSLSVNNRAGWTSGVAAADLASLTTHPEVDDAATA